MELVQLLATANVSWSCVHSVRSPLSRDRFWIARKLVIKLEVSAWYISTDTKSINCTELDSNYTTTRVAEGIMGQR